MIEQRPILSIAAHIVLIIGVLLVAEGIGEHFNRGYIYFAIVFAFVLEMINMQTDKHHARKVKKQAAKDSQSSGHAG